MNDDSVPRVHAPTSPQAAVPTVPRGGGAPIGEDAELQNAHIAPEGDLTVHQTKAAREAEEGYSPFGGLAPDRPHRSTLDNSPTEGMEDNKY